MCHKTNKMQMVLINVSRENNILDYVVKQFLSRSFPWRLKNIVQRCGWITWRNKTLLRSELYNNFQMDKLLRTIKGNPPSPMEPGGTYARSPSPEPPPPPPSGEKDITHYLGYWLPLALTKTPPFSAFSENLPETEAKKSPLSWESGNGHAAPLCIRVGGGGGIHKIKNKNSRTLREQTTSMSFW